MVIPSSADPAAGADPFAHKLDHLPFGSSAKAEVVIGVPVEPSETDGRLPSSPAGEMEPPDVMGEIAVALLPAPDQCWQGRRDCEEGFLSCFEPDSGEDGSRSDCTGERSRSIQQMWTTIQYNGPNDLEIMIKSCRQACSDSTRRRRRWSSTS